MKKILFLVMMIGISLHGFGQDELNRKQQSIPPKNSENKEVIPPTETPPTAEPPALSKEPIVLKINPDELFNNNILYKKEANVEGVFYRRNEYLGGFVTKSFTSTIRYRDAAFVDGDKIKVYLNDKVIEPEVLLDGSYKGFKINLVKGINKIDFEALNEGSASPNTAEFQVYDDKGDVIESSQWNVGKGYKAVIILYKE
ncbi:hypothetical protein SAMN05444397_101843 [Flavobacterium aquidurense]|uniref:Secreted protein n=1 Tax=Flavobacterium frigidimaris TaxID=262320 RepID=A0ABX4BVJ1_FLAFR|nr:hypothetical protein [Flavobacterium frigidimaris]OXA82115.1 hypothetical protein B0A65_01795 [Flavobacterium frigidimaris]SDY52139.1 hypothetical protein SAMN05444397_101843 [Flavobacterium aquidurense]